MARQLVDYPDKDWQRAVENVRDAAAAIWDRQAYRHAIDQGSAHAQRVVRLLDWLTQGLMTHGETPLAEAVTSPAGTLAETARDLAYRLYTTCERKG